MEQLVEMIAVLVVMYVVYALTMGKWNYTSAALREQRKNELKEAGVSVRFYFTHPLTQFLLTVASGGIFTLYWLYKQWSQILRGFKRLDGTPLPGTAFGRMLNGYWNFLVLGNLLNRTCEYMGKETSWPSWLWGTAWLGGLVLVFVPVAGLYRTAGFLFFCFVPCVFQRRINTLTSEHISAFPRAVEIIVTLLGVVCVAGAVVAWRKFVGN